MCGTHRQCHRLYAGILPIARPGFRPGGSFFVCSVSISRWRAIHAAFTRGRGRGRDAGDYNDTDMAARLQRPNSTSSASGFLMCSLITRAIGRAPISSSSAET
jgi:hypothetical protein